MNKVFMELEKIRQSQTVNMLDKHAVTNAAVKMGYFDTSDWINSHGYGAYGEVILNRLPAWRLRMGYGLEANAGPKE